MKSKQKNSEVPTLLMELFDEARLRCQNEEDARFRLALLGLINAFETDIGTFEMLERIKADVALAETFQNSQARHRRKLTQTSIK